MKEQGAKPSLQTWLDALGGDIVPWEIKDACLDVDNTQTDSVDDLVFGTGGIRCLMGVGPNRMNAITVGQVTQGLANWLQKNRAAEGCSLTPRIAIVHDTRIHSELFAHTAACVLAANDFLVLLLSAPQPTPLLSFAVRQKQCAAGVCITASHNPREWNGYKVYDAAGVQATDDMAHAIQKEIAKVDPFCGVKTMRLEEATRTGCVVYEEPSLIEDYHRALMAQRFNIDCRGLHVVYSPLNGTGLNHAIWLFDKLGIDYSIVQSQAEPDGHFPMCPKPNPENLDALAEGMRQLEHVGADVFLATDPDADRLGVVCEHNGRAVPLSGDEVGLLLLDFVARIEPYQVGSSKALVAVTTVVTSPLADAIASAHGIEIRRTLTGFKYIGEQIGLILEEGKDFVLGIEESDGYLKGSYVRDKDGLNALVLVCELASYYKARGKDLVQALDDLYVRYGYVLGRHMSIDYADTSSAVHTGRFMETLRQVPPKKIAGKTVLRVVDYLAESFLSDVLEWNLDGGSRIVIRPSGTEPKIKAYVFASGQNKRMAELLLDELCEGLRMHVLENGGWDL